MSRDPAELQIMVESGKRVPMLDEGGHGSGCSSLLWIVQYNSI
jgi:hypothetical protein